MTAAAFFSAVEAFSLLSERNDERKKNYKENIFIIIIIMNLLLPPAQCRRLVGALFNSSPFKYFTTRRHLLFQHLSAFFTIFKLYIGAPFLIFTPPDWRKSYEKLV